MMSVQVIMPALEMAQDTGKLIRWLKREGERVTKGEPLMEIETDKVTVEIEAPASGVLAQVTARDGDVIAVGKAVAMIVAEGETPTRIVDEASLSLPASSAPIVRGVTPHASPLARKVADEHGVDLAQVQASGARVEKADVEAYITNRRDEAASAVTSARVIPASPKARRLAQERGIDMTALSGTGPDGAVLAADVLNSTPLARGAAEGLGVRADSLPTIWRVMAERMTQSWTSVPHFFLVREVMASALIGMRARISPAIEKRQQLKPTYSDLLIKLVATVLRDHPRVNASWIEDTIRENESINIGLATAIDEGLVVPVIAQADRLSIGEIAAARAALIERANTRKLRPVDIAHGTFAISNLGMYNVDAFSAIVNPPQAAILAVGRIADRVVPVSGQPAVRPMMVLTLSCDHRVVDGARAARFLDDLANLIAEPWGLLA